MVSDNLARARDSRPACGCLQPCALLSSSENQFRPVIIWHFGTQAFRFPIMLGASVRPTRWQQCATALFWFRGSGSGNPSPGRTALSPSTHSLTHSLPSPGALHTIKLQKWCQEWRWEGERAERAFERSGITSSFLVDLEAGLAGPGAPLLPGMLPSAHPQSATRHTLY